MKQILTALSPRDRRTLLIGAVSIGGLLFVARVLPAWRRWQVDVVASAQSASATTARDRKLALNARAIHDSLVARRTRLAALAPAWLLGDSPAAASAELAQLVTRAATDAAMTLGALDLRTDSVGHELFVPVHVRLSVTGDVQGLATFLAALDRGPGALNVRSLDVQAGDPNASAQRPEVLHADLVIDALWRRVNDIGARR
ncbi:MAG TPA: GspMb/PilO family protein [Gemmatimonadaceae bacterium]|nr:GspMb/PilO family protein [Gemmatimonadaceae bacterium]